MRSAKTSLSAYVGVLVLVVTLIGEVSAQSPVVVDLAQDTDAIRCDARRVDDLFGDAADSCDVNGDGIEDWIVSAYEGHGPGNSRFRAGDVYLFFGRRGRWTGPLAAADDADVVIYGQQAVDKLGHRLSCGDIDGDGTGDLLLGADLADGPNDSRNDAGQVHILFGRSNWPSEIDLLTDPGTVVYGQLAGSSIPGNYLAAGDVNGDGIDDLVIPSISSPDRNGQFDRVGRVYVLWGRESWPSTIDLALATERDLTIYGATLYDGLGGLVATGDVDEDGTADLILKAGGGDGPTDGREDAGDLYLFWGRPVWPEEIDLRVEQADMLLFGPDISDFAGDGVAVGDIDNDGHPEITVGIARGDGRFDTQPELGEGRIYEPYPSYPAVVDLAVDSDTTVWGADEADLFLCGIAGVRDVTGDGLDDLICSATQADGPANDETRMGEIYIFTGGAGFPAEIGADNQDYDWIIYGRQAGDGLGEIGQADINGDGIKEIIAKTLVGNDFLVSSSWLISPVDVDGDGLTQLPDNCPLVVNPGQEDSDADGRGDACATDWDGDGIEDPEDCAIANAMGGRPPAITGVLFAAGSHEELLWTSEPLAEEYDVSRGDLGSIGAGQYGACRNDQDADRTDTSFVDTEVPPARAGFFYLFRGVDLDCPAVGSWGTTSSGSERVNSDPAGCP